MSNAYEVAPRRQPSKPRGIFDCEPEEEMHMTEEEKRLESARAPRLPRRKKHARAHPTQTA